MILFYKTILSFIGSFNEARPGRSRSRQLRAGSQIVILLLTIYCLLSGAAAKAQGDNHAIFLTEGRIEFEKKVNTHARMQDDNEWTELAKKATSQFKTTYFNLYFHNDKTLYKPGRENQDAKESWFDQPVADANIIYSDLDKGRSISQKKVFEQQFLIDDSMRVIKWKITDETRNIAGFTCRRANAIIMDSIYVVAFYTDEIIPSGGPESFSGLPGMILGVAMPHEHLSWFATKVEAVPITDAQLPAPQKGKKIDNAALRLTLTERMKDWGKYAQLYQKTIML